MDFIGRQLWCGGEPSSDPDYPHVVQQVIQFIHHAGKNVVEADGRVGATVQALNEI